MAHSVYAIIVFMSVATTLIAPPLLAIAFRRATRDEQQIIAGLG
jgi:Kef-type K+ transport system membrane component KefB